MFVGQCVLFVLVLSLWLSLSNISPFLPPLALKIIDVASFSESNRYLLVCNVIVNLQGVCAWAFRTKACSFSLNYDFCIYFGKYWFHVLLIASPVLQWLYSDVDGKQAFAIHWEPPPESAHRWKNMRPNVPKSLRIYECHVGISGSEQKISSFNEFTENVPSWLLYISFFLSVILSTSYFLLCSIFLITGPSSYKRSWIQCNPVDWSCWAQRLFLCRL